MFFSDYSLGRELGHDLSFIDPIKDIQQRYLAVKRYFSQYGHFQQQSFEGGGRCKSSTLLGRNGSAIYGGGRPCECSQPKPQRGSATILEQGGGKAPSDWKRPKGCSISLGISSLGTNNGGVWSQATLRTATLGMSATGAAVSKKKKSASDLGKPSTASEPTALHRLQYRERQHSLPVLPETGGATATHYEQCA